MVKSNERVSIDWGGEEKKNSRADRIFVTRRKFLSHDKVHNEWAVCVCVRWHLLENDRLSYKIKVDLHDRLFLT